MKEGIELSPARREANLAAIREVSEDLYRKVLDEGIHGHMGDGDLELAAARARIWADRVKGK